MVNIHILVIYTCKHFWYCFILYEILRLQFGLKPSMMLHFLAFHSRRRFCVNEYRAKIYTKIICHVFSGRLDVHLQVIQPILKFPYLISPIKYPPPPPNTSFEIRKSLKRMPSLVYTEMDQTKYRVSLMFAFECIIWTLLHVFTCT